jgi:hypothetical protein
MNFEVFLYTVRMNPYLQKMSIEQLQDVFIETTREFVRALEMQAPFSKLKYLRDQIKGISEVIEARKSGDLNHSIDGNFASA